MSEVLPNFNDGIPIDEEAEPEDAEVEHLVPSPDDSEGFMPLEKPEESEDPA